MIVIKVEMWPYGEKQNKFTLASGMIENDGTGDTLFGNYKGKFTYIVPDIDEPSDELKMKGEVKGFPRHEGILKLLVEMLNNMHDKEFEEEYEALKLDGESVEEANGS